MTLKNNLLPFLMVFFLLSVPAASFAQNTSPPQQISLSQAITMAQNSNVGSIISNINVQQAQNAMATATSGFSSSGSFTPSNGLNAGATKGAVGLMQTNYNLQNAFATNAYQQNNVTYQAESAYFAVEDAVYGEQVAQTSVSAAQEAYREGKASYQQGVETATDLATAKSNLEVAQSKLTAAQAGVDAAFVNFDNTVGLDPSEHPDLTTNVSYDPNYVAGVVSAAQAVSQTLSNNYQAVEAQNNVLLQGELSLYSNPSNNGPLDYQQAQLAQQQVIQGLTGEARAAYLALGSNQDAYNAAQKAVIAAQASYSNAQAEYNAGVITKEGLLEAQLGFISAKQGLQASLHTLLLARANLALITGVGSVTIPG
ncbi:MAG: TolC family protein [Peptococcaceae bacterium]|jgi:outer membrane protein TolC|nr:TolC family protein [Peptococcaceae bacterium]